MREFSGQRAVVTRSMSGIGRATAKALIRERALVLTRERSAARGAEVVAAIKAPGGEAPFPRADLGSPDDVRALAERAAGVDLVNAEAIVLASDGARYLNGAVIPIDGGRRRRLLARIQNLELAKESP